MKRVLVTGASSGIGLAIASRLADEGMSVVGTSRDPGCLSEVGGRIPFVALDVTDPDLVRRGVTEAIDILGGLDVLFNNAGISHMGPLEMVSGDVARRIIETNVLGLAAVTREVIPVMRKQRSGLIVNTGSLAGLMGIPYQAYYAAGKYAVEGLTESLRMELKPFNIKVTVIEPGNFKTAIADRRDRVDDAPDDYQHHYRTARGVTESSMEAADPPDVVADLAVRIIHAKNPKARYPVGKSAGLIRFLVKYLPDGITERILWRYYKLV